MKKKSLSVFIIILLIAIIILLVALLIPQNEDDTGKGVVFEPNNSSQTQGYVGTNLPGIAIPGWGAIKLPSGVKEADVSLHNPESNQGYYDLSFTLKLADSGEEIFSTGPIEPGYKCTHVTLTRELEPGEYEAIMFVQPYLQDEDQTPTNNAELEILLIVE